VKVGRRETWIIVDQISRGLRAISQDARQIKPKPSMPYA
jgi:hypothetical protein